MERRNEINRMKEPAVFLQTRSTTCGIACLMMALEAQGADIRLSKGTEGQLYRELKSKFHEIVPVMMLAWHAKVKTKHEVEVVIEHGKVDFWKFLKANDEEMFQIQERSYALARQGGVGVQYEQVTLERVNGMLKDNKILIVGTDLGDGIKHALLVYDFDGKNYKIIDPLSGKRSIRAEHFLSTLKMDFGSWIIGIGKSALQQ